MNFSCILFLTVDAHLKKRRKRFQDGLLINVLLLAILNKSLERVGYTGVDASLLCASLVMLILIYHELKDCDVVEKAVEGGLADKGRERIEDLLLSQDFVKVVDLLLMV
jgi:hypothetical protein